MRCARVSTALEAHYRHWTTLEIWHKASSNKLQGYSAMNCDTGTGQNSGRGHLPKSKKVCSLVCCVMRGKVLPAARVYRDFVGVNAGGWALLTSPFHCEKRSAANSLHVVLGLRNGAHEHGIISMGNSGATAVSRSLTAAVSVATLIAPPLTKAILTRAMQSWLTMLVALSSGSLTAAVLSCICDRCCSSSNNSSSSSSNSSSSSRALIPVTIAQPQRQSYNVCTFCLPQPVLHSKRTAVKSCPVVYSLQGVYHHLHATTCTTAASTLQSSIYANRVILFYCKVDNYYCVVLKTEYSVLTSQLLVSTVYSVIVLLLDQIVSSVSIPSARVCSVQLVRDMRYAAVSCQRCCWWINVTAVDAAAAGGCVHVLTFVQAYTISAPEAGSNVDQLTGLQIATGQCADFNETADIQV
eukprot:18038-Heterococcus_DN1.PRE.3